MVDPIEALAQRLRAAYFSDTKREGEAWETCTRAQIAAWRRVAAAAIDAGAKL